MNRTILFTLLATGTALAGPNDQPLAGGSEPDAFEWLTPSFDTRTRYEFREVDGNDPSHALTARARVGLTLGSFQGFSAFGELEANYAIVDDYKSNPTGSASTDPFVLGNTPIGDPENVELNRAWAQWTGHGLTVKAGRQRIKRNNDAFIGNVGWRQNEQTFDAVSLSYNAEAYSLFYAYSNRVQRIFGDDANDALPGPPLKDFEGEFHLIDGTYEASFGTLGGYAYLIDVDNNAAVGESNTYGAHLTSGPFYVEAAYQDGTSGAMDYDAWYGHVKYTKKVGGATYGVGLEFLEDYFKTPFATVHAFNGFADAFILQRIGLNQGPGGTYDGIANIYLSYVRGGLPFGLTFKGFGHLFLNDGFSDTYGYEIDAILAKKISDNATALAKGAYFFSDSGSSYPDIQQVTIELNVKF